MGAGIGALLVVFAFAIYNRPQGMTGDVILASGVVLVGLALLRGLRHPKAALLPWLFAALAMASSVWSSESKTSLTLALALVVPLYMAGLIAKNVEFSRFLRIADITLKWVVVISIAAGYLIPAIGITQRVVNHGTLRGIFEHRNGMGFFIVIALITHLAVNWGEKKNFLRRWAWLGLFIFGLQLSDSSGALILVAIALVLYGVVRQASREKVRNRWPILTATTCFALALSPLLAVFGPQLLGLVGRDASFTGRTDIWAGAVAAWQEKFWFGYGWANILGEDSEAARTIGAYAGYTVRSSHNGYLAVGLQLGIVGLTIAVLYLLQLLGRTLRLALRSPGPQAIWSFQILLVIIVGDFAETRAFVNIGWFLLAIIACYLRPHFAVEREPRTKNERPKAGTYRLVNGKPVLSKPIR